MKAPPVTAFCLADSWPCWKTMLALLAFVLKVGFAAATEQQAPAPEQQPAAPAPQAPAAPQQTPATEPQTGTTGQQPQTNAPAAAAAAQKLELAPPRRDSNRDASGGFGIGALLGEPTGLSLKGWLSDRSAVDAAVAWSFSEPSSFHAHGDWLYHNFDLLPVPRGKLPVYCGVGGRVKFERHRDTRAGVRAPIGLAYLFENTPVDIFVEVAPILDLTPKTRFAVNGGIGVRFYFR